MKTEGRRFPGVGLCDDSGAAFPRGKHVRTIIVIIIINDSIYPAVSNGSHKFRKYPLQNFQLATDITHAYYDPTLCKAS